MTGFQDVDDLVQAFGENAGANPNQILRDSYLINEPIYSVGDGVRIMSHPDSEDLSECPDPVGTIIEVDVDNDWWGPHKVDVKFLGTWFYCKGSELEELTPSERLFYGV